MVNPRKDENNLVFPESTRKSPGSRRYQDGKRNAKIQYFTDKTKKWKRMGPLRFELRTSAMSRRRHSQLDHEPANCLMLYNFCLGIIKN
jgi:hypothetical protein